MSARELVAKLRMQLAENRMSPICIDLGGIDFLVFVEELKRYNLVESFCDNLTSQLVELNQESSNEKKFQYPSLAIYYPWVRTVVHSLQKKDYRRVRLSRNRGLISEKEQDKLANLTIGFAGLNVGAAGAVCMALEGIGQTYKLADFDELSLSNLNRFNASILTLGQKKTALTAQKIFEIDPFFEVNVFHEGVTAKNVQTFISLPKKIDLLIEEMDDLWAKVEVRRLAKIAGIPVVMVTGNGQDLIIDIERYDLDPNIKILNGLLPDDFLRKPLKDRDKFSPQEYAELCRDFIGTEWLDKKLLDAFERVGKDLRGIPQLAECTWLRGAALANVARKIFTGTIKSGRYTLSMSELK